MGTCVQEIFYDNMWQGRRCFIVGGGPSLKDFDFTQLNGELVIGVNRAFEKLPWSAITCSMDGQFWRNYAKDLLMHGSNTVILAVDPATSPVEMLVARSAGRWGLSPSITHGLCHGCNSGYMALNLALCLGADPIYLLGFDMHQTNGADWWHNGYPWPGTPRKYSRFISHFNKIAGDIKPGRVINCNESSRLRCFPFGTWERQSHPVYVSYYTLNGYQEEKKMLVRSLRTFGLQYEIDQIEDFGSWQANTQYKAQFILDKLDKYTGRPVVFVDVDAEIMRYPEAFCDLDKQADIACHWRNGRELLSGTMFVANSNATRTLLNSWVDLNQINKFTWEQKNLQQLLDNSLDINMMRLGPEYCFIFDTMQKENPGIDPVIEHFQASRYLKNCRTPDRKKAKKKSVKIGPVEPVQEKVQYKFDRRCAVCKGTGRVANKQCIVCKGSGVKLDGSL